MGSHKSLILARPGARVVGRGDLERTTLYPEVCAARSAETPSLARHPCSGPGEARSCAGACPHLTPFLPLRYFSMTSARRTLPTGEGEGVISAQFISSFRSAGSPALRAVGPRLRRSGAFIILFK